MRSHKSSNFSRTNFRLFLVKKLSKYFVKKLSKNSKNCLFSLNIHIFIFTFSTYILSKFFSLSYKKDEKRRFLTYFLCKIGYSVFPSPAHDPTYNPLEPLAPQPKICEVANPPNPRINAYERVNK